MIYVFLAEGFEEIEAVTPADCLRRAGKTVQTVGVGGRVIAGSHGIPVTADIAAEDILLDDALEMIVLPGGMPGTRNLGKSQAVQDAISGAIGEGEKITDVSFDGKDLKITVDLSEIEVKLGTPRDVALSRISSITDNILDLDDSYYNTWETITLDFGAQGTIRLDKSMVADQGLGRYFNFKDDDLE